MEKKQNANRFRNIDKKIRLSEDEETAIFERMKECKISNFNTYARVMLLNGEIYNIDTKDIKEHTLALNKIGVNINQIAVKLNANNYDTSDILELKTMLQELINGEKEIIKACRKINNLR